MSLAEVMSAVAALPRADKEQLLSILQKEFDSKVAEKPGGRFVPRPEDNCPFTAEEIQESMQDMSGRTLSEILRSRGLR
jgi:hypothetical protein